MNKKYICIITVLLGITALLSGCQLAKVEAEEGQETDGLIGVYVTTHYVDLFDMEAYLKKNTRKLINGKDVKFTKEYEGRIFATVKTNNTNIHPVKEYVFGDLEGVPFFVEYSEINGEISRGLKTGGEFTDGKFKVIVKEGESTSIEGTLHYSNTEKVVLYCNPVYLTPEGDIYLKSGQGTAPGGHGTMTITMSETKEINNNGEVENYTITIKINAEPKSDVTKYVIKHMNSKDEITGKMEITKNNIPDSIEIPDDSEYTLFEEHTFDMDNKPVINRSILDTSDKVIECYFKGEGALITPKRITIK